MPELPEVETVVRQLHSKIAGKKVVSVESFDDKVIDPKLVTLPPFTITSVTRRGKLIIIETNKGHLLVHLRMTGHFNGDKYCKGIFHFEDGMRLTHHSIRRFGGITLYSKEELGEKLSVLGSEPLEISSSNFASILSKYPNANIKNKLLDQTCVVGIGNIYAMEALYHAGIDPRCKISEVSTKKLSTLHQETRRILLLSIVNNGATVDNYSNLDGRGDFQNLLAVYGKDTCPKGHSLIKIKQGGRGTWYCGNCQE